MYLSNQQNRLPEISFDAQWVSNISKAPPLLPETNVPQVFGQQITRQKCPHNKKRNVTLQQRKKQKATVQRGPTRLFCIKHAFNIYRDTGSASHS